MKSQCRLALLLICADNNRPYFSGEIEVERALYTK